MIELFQPVLALFGGEVAIAMAVAAAAAAIATPIMAAQAAEKQAKTEKKMYEYNASLQRAEGEARDKAAKAEEQKIAQRQRLYRGSQKATMAKQGFSIEEGSNIDVLANTYGEFANDRLTTLRNGMLEKMSLNASANLSSMQGKAAMQRGKNQARASYLSAAGAGLKGYDTLSGLNWGGSVKQDKEWELW
jgi:Tfp pilus assembly protein FimT